MSYHRQREAAPRSCYHSACRYLLSAPAGWGDVFFVLAFLIASRLYLSILPARDALLGRNSYSDAHAFIMASNVSSQPTCQNCSTSTTPLWRRDEYGSVLCNACGLFLKLHGRPRPISLKTDVIKSRNRAKVMRPDVQGKKKVCQVHAPNTRYGRTCRRISTPLS